MRKLFFLVLLVGGCSIEKRGAPGTDPTQDIVVGNANAPDSIEAIIATTTYAAVGDSVPIGIVIRNTTDHPIDLHLTGRETAFDIAVLRADSTPVWRRLQNQAVQQILQLKQLAPGESFTLSDRWQATEAGNFLIRAEVPTDAAPIAAAPVRLLVR